MMIDAELAASIALLAFVSLSFVDGIVIHLWRERLHTRPDSRLEHGLHTARAVLFPFILIAFFADPSTRALGLAFVAVDQVVEVWDMAVERQSRAYSGGLRSSEYIVHGSLITLRSAAIAFTLLAGPSTSAPEWLSLARIASFLLPGAAVVAILHVALLVAPGIIARSPRGVRA